MVVFISIITFSNKKPKRPRLLAGPTTAVFLPNLRHQFKEQKYLVEDFLAYEGSPLGASLAPWEEDVKRPVLILYIYRRH